MLEAVRYLNAACVAGSMMSMRIDPNSPVDQLPDFSASSPFFSGFPLRLTLRYSSLPPMYSNSTCSRSRYFQSGFRVLFS